MHERRISHRELEVWHGSRLVRIWSNEARGPFTSTLWVNDGETITTTRAKAKTLNGARKQAERMLGLERRFLVPMMDGSGVWVYVSDSDPRYKDAKRGGHIDRSVYHLVDASHPVAS